MKLLSRVWLFATPWTVACQSPLSIGFSRQEYWSGLPFPSPGDLPNPGIKPGSPSLQADALSSEPPGKPPNILHNRINIQNELSQLKRRTEIPKLFFVLIEHNLLTEKYTNLKCRQCRDQWILVFTYLLGCARSYCPTWGLWSSLWHVTSLVVPCKIFKLQHGNSVVECRI